MSGTADITGTVDAAVLGGGVMGCATALHLARGGMDVALVEGRGLCMAASGVNAGTLSMQHLRDPAVVACAIEGNALWRDARRWLGRDVGYERRGGLVLAFTEAEAEALTRLTAARQTAGAPVELVDAARARGLEPGLSPSHSLSPGPSPGPGPGPGPVIASWCPGDGHANPALAGRAFRGALAAAGARVMEGAVVDGIERHRDLFTVRLGGGRLAARRVVLAGGAGLATMMRWLGCSVADGWRPQQIAVTERAPEVLRTVLGVVNGRLSVKQLANGTVLIGGGWIGKGDLRRTGDEVSPRSLVGNVRLARHAVPALGGLRIVRVWLGVRDTVTDAGPAVGPLPGIDGAFVIGCGISGYTVGPVLGRRLADHILGRAADDCLFDPSPILGRGVDCP